MTWALVAMTIWLLASAMVLAMCMVAARADRANDEAAAPLPAPVSIGVPYAPDLEARRLHRSVRALADLVDAAHVRLVRPSGEVLVQVGDAVVDAQAPSLVAPLVCDGRRVGTLTARRASGATPFSPRQFETFYAVAVVLGAAIETAEHETAAVRHIAGQRRLRVT